jgi:hypothetical protein
MVIVLLNIERRKEQMVSEKISLEGDGNEVTAKL